MIRVKPLGHGETAAGWCVEGTRIYHEEKHREHQDFCFDQVVADDVDTETLFKDHILELIKQCGDGFNSTVFAYG